MRRVRTFLLRKFTGRYLSVAALLVLVVGAVMLFWSWLLDKEEERGR